MRCSLGSVWARCAPMSLRASTPFPSGPTTTTEPAVGGGGDAGGYGIAAGGGGSFASVGVVVFEI